MEDKTGLTLEQAQARIAELESTESQRIKENEQGVQKILSEKKELEAMVDYQSKLTKNAGNIVSLQEENPELLQKVLDKYYDGMTYEQAIVENNITVEDKPKLTKEEAVALAKAEIQQSKVQELESEFFEKGSFWDKEEEIMNTYKDLTESRPSLSKAQATKYLNMAKNYVLPMSKDTTWARDIAAGAAKTKGTSSKGLDRDIEYSRKLLESS